MKKIIFLILIIYIGSFLDAQQRSPYDHTINPMVLNTIDRLLKDNNLYKQNMAAQDYNIAGMYFYERKSWHEADLMFSMAIYLDTGHILALYNLACVYSIQLDDYIRQNSDYYFGYNEVLLEQIYVGMIFGKLYSSIELEPSRRIRARQDPDLVNLRKYDPDLFDAITLPEEQRTKYRYNGIYIHFVQFENIISFCFIEYNSQEDWTKYRGWNNYEKWTKFYGHQKLLMDLELCVLREDGFGWNENDEKIGKRFLIEYIYLPQRPDLGAFESVHGSKNIISVIEMQ